MNLRLKRFLTIIYYVVFSLLLAEIGLRLANGVSPLELINFRNDNPIGIDLTGMVRYDARLGWTHRSHTQGGDITTLDHGIRRNGATQTETRRGGLLAVGSSFTAGSGVSDDKTWPAMLEALVNSPVHNAGVGAFGMDQVMLRAEELMPILQPEVLLIGIMENTISWSGYSYLTRHKPYFTVEDRQLVAHNSPVPTGQLVNAVKDSWWGRVGAYSYVVDRIMATIDPDRWYLPAEKINLRTQNDEVDVTCLHLQRVKRLAERLNTRVLLVPQFGGSHVTGNDALPVALAMVRECGAEMGIRFVDVFSELREAYETDSAALRDYYQMENGNTYGHWSEEGNEHVARVTAAALSEAPGSGRAADFRLSGGLAGDGRNLIPSSEALDVVFRPTPALVVRRARSEGRRSVEFELSAVGSEGPHAVSTWMFPVGAGPSTVSFEMRAEDTAMVRVTLAGESGEGFYAEFDVERSTTNTGRIGPARRLHAGMETLDEGWHRAWLGGTTAGGEMRLSVQVRGTEGEWNFLPVGEAVSIRGVQLERGRSASVYRPTSGPFSPGFVPGDGNNLVDSEGLEALVQASDIATLRPESFEAGRIREYRVRAGGAEGEHYLRLREVPVEQGANTLSMQFKPQGTSHVRVQFMDSGNNGVIGEFNLQEGMLNILRMNAAEQLNGTIESLDDGWVQVSLSTTLPERNATTTIQLLNQEVDPSFAPSGEGVSIRAVQLERGQSASAYRATSGPLSPGFVPGDGNNLVDSESLQPLVLGSDIATLRPEPSESGRISEYRVLAGGAEGEHYLRLREFVVDQGASTLSMQLRPEGTSRGRIHLMDSANNGVIGEFELEERVLDIVGMNAGAKLNGTIELLDDGWVQLSLTTTLPERNATTTIQLLGREGATAFAPEGESFRLRALQLERGESATRYVPR